MKFSVIIPLYNCEKYINNCLESIVNQDYKNLEIIVINDGSTDKSIDIVKKYMLNDKRIKLFNNENHGVSFTRNFGVNIATGDYIHFVDADDIVENGLYYFSNKLLSNKKYDFIRFNYVFNNNGNKIKNNEYKFKEDIQVNKNFIKKNIINKILDEKLKAYVWQLIIKNENIPKFSEKLKILEDEKFCLELYFQSNSGYITNKAFYSYNISNVNSATKSYSKILVMMNNMLEANKEIKKILYKNIDNPTIALSIFDTRMAHSYSNYLEILINHSKKYKESINKFKENCSGKKLKKIFSNLDYKKLNIKHVITTYLTLNEHFIILCCIYFFKKIFKGEYL